MNKKYFAQAFMPRDLNHAKDVALTPDPMNPNKWIEETQDDVEKIISSFAENGQPITEDSVIIDYGCGVGRVSRGLIEKTNCKVIGVDFSPNMLQLSFNYTSSPNFMLCPQLSLSSLASKGLQVDGVLAIWVLQHSQDPKKDLEIIKSVLKPNGLFFLRNNFERYIPGEPKDGYVQWWSDGYDIIENTKSSFSLKSEVEKTDVSHTGIYQKS